MCIECPLYMFIQYLMYLSDTTRDVIGNLVLFFPATNLAARSRIATGKTSDFSASHQQEQKH